MTYNKKKIYETAVAAIEKNKLFFIEDVVAFLPISKKTFYQFFPLESNESNALKELLENNKIIIKSSMRSKWYKSNNASLQIALMKMICSDDEAHRLNGSSIKTDITSGGKEIQTVSKITVNIVKPLDDDDYE